jgi:glutathione S-transferase
MPVNPDAPIQVSAFNWVPPFARGLVRDLRVRWALEEAGRDYAVRTLDARAERPADYLLEQPFGQVPSYSDETVNLFESGAIVLHIGEDCEALLPRDPAARARAVAWAFAALNSVETMVQQLAAIDLFYADAGWAKERRPEIERMVRGRLSAVATHLGDKEWLEGRFTAGDLLMVTVLRNLRQTDLVAEYPNLTAYQARGEARPAFQRALDAQMADFEEPAAA